MPRKRGNTTNYPKITDEKNDEDRWGKAVEVHKLSMPVWDLRHQLKYPDSHSGDDKLPDTISVAAVRQGLDYLAAATGDTAFSTARLVLDSYSLEGGLKSALIRMVRGSNADVITMMMQPMRDLLLQKPHLSEREAAREIAIQRGVPGASLAAVCDELRKAYPVWKHSSGQSLPSGDTGLKLRVQLGKGFRVGPDTTPWSIHGSTFDESGFGIVPDDRGWRRLIAEGRVVLHGPVSPRRAGSETPEN